MASDGGVPHERAYVFVGGTLLHEELVMAAYHVEVDDGMEETGASVDI
jgi:hypothetical protein